MYTFNPVSVVVPAGITVSKVSTRKGDQMMNPRLSVLAIALCLVPIQIAAQAPAPNGNSAAKVVSVVKPTKWTVPRLPDGHPDLQGYWTNNTATPLQRPAGAGE